jgi:hypothetical protein
MRLKARVLPSLSFVSKWCPGRYVGAADVLMHTSDKRASLETSVMACNARHTTFTLEHEKMEFDEEVGMSKDAWRRTSYLENTAGWRSFMSKVGMTMF